MAHRFEPPMPELARYRFEHRTRNSEQDDGNKENSTSDLAKYVKAAAPNATRMQVSHGEYPVARGKKYWESMQMFMNAYYRPSGTLIMELDSHYLIPDDGIEMTVHMSSLSFVWNECSNDALKLMKLQCSTLQEVTIHSIDTDDLSSLLLDDNGTVVTYPYLLNLTLDGQAGMEVTNRLEFEDAVPFPRLVKLNANIIYPFGDDVLFRGNSGSLEELSLNFDYATATIINRANVFTPGKYKKLKTVDIRSFIEDIDNCDKQVKHHMKLLQGVASTTKKLLIRDIDISQSFLEILPKSRLFKDIHTLCLNEIHLGLVDILEILTALSALQFLESGLVELVATTNSIGIHDLDTLCRKYSMINKCFYKWRVPQESIISVESGAQYAVILAMLCPRFRIIQLPDQHKPEYFEKVKHYMNGPYFLKYPNVQNRLLSIKSEYDCCV
ncbi:hypothetical protein GGI25_000874 [Coemansia spiralis]|uniref:Uncharacterized protein n=2 Tax=Coemansia TaxID=4863 RepID=A0A9W8GC21_9FUNG|nr:hypothetical protein EDC05_001759 [Coemansia umbellata]KAJ2623611.1 hypothetical protein GGI26_002249 [Coemansia sp. RSA 1358]KAJ2680281.1 hypothetical protein GGI25_000874 [Coemansia spiralis]